MWTRATRSPKRSISVSHAGVFVAALGVAVGVTALDAVMLPDFLWASLDWPDSLLLLVALLGNGLGPGLLFYVAAVGILAARRLAGRARRPSLLVAGLAGALALPWGVHLAGFALSGSLAQTLPALLLLQAAMAAAVALFFAVAAGWIAARWCTGRGNAWLAAPLVASAVGVAAASHHLYPDEYLLLHTQLGVATVTLLGLATLEALGTRVRDSRGATALTATVVAFFAACAVGLPSWADVSWIVWGEATFARHTTGPLVSPSWLVPSEIVAAPRVEPPAPPLPAEERRRAALREADPPHIVLFFVDNVQRERVGLYGYRENPTTPHLDALFRNAVIFERAVSPIPATRNFMTMLLTGRFAPDVTMHRTPEEYRRESITRLLHERGYRTYVQGVFELSIHAELREADYAIDRFFPPLAVRQEEARKRRKGLVRTLAEQMDGIREVVKQARKEKRPALIWVHLMGPHLAGRSFVPSPDFPFGDSVGDQYDSAIAAADAEVVALQELMEQEGGERNVVWVFGSDHGPGLGRYAKAATKTLFADHIDVPLTILAPGFEPRRVKRPVGAPLDLASTVLDLAGVPIPAGYHGTSLLADMVGASPGNVPIVLHLSAPGSRWAGCISGRFKAIERQGKAKYLFDLVADPREKRNLAPKQAGRVSELLAVYDARMPDWFATLHELTGETYQPRK